MKARRPDVTNFGTTTMSPTKRKFTATEDHTGRSDTSLKCCPINNTLGIIGKKFTILILRNMIYGKQSRFNQLLSSIENGNPKTLSTRLKEMEKYGLIKRIVYSNEKPVRVEYEPVEKGLALQPILDMMAAYSMKYCSKDIFKDARARKFREVYGIEMAKFSSPG